MFDRASAPELDTDERAALSGARMATVAEQFLFARPQIERFAAAR
jgi:hypothetical protein